ncbi:MAG: energy transducer TonB [Thermodesulfobacteriota bacterium]
MSGKKRQSQAVELYGADLRPSFWAVCVFASLFIHVAVLGFVAFSPWAGSDEQWRRPGDTIDVDLVSFNPETPAPPGNEDAQAGGESSPADTDDRGAPVEDSGEESSSDSGDGDEQAVAVKKGRSRNVAKGYDLKEPSSGDSSDSEAEEKEPVDPDKVLADAVSRLEEQAEKQGRSSVEDRISRLRGEVEDEDYRERLRQRASQGSQGAAPSGDLDPLEVYQAEVAALMKQNWAFSSDMAGENTKGLEARLIIKITGDGQIEDVWFEKRSGNSYLDESAYRTVMKADPLPPLPEGQSQYHLMLGFTPGGLRH